MKKWLFITSIFLASSLITACSESNKETQSPANLSSKNIVQESVNEDQIPENSRITAISTPPKDTNDEISILKKEISLIDVDPDIHNFKNRIPQEITDQWIDKASAVDETAMFIIAMMYRINSRSHDYYEYFNLEKLDSKYENFVESIRCISSLEDQSSIFADLIKSPTLIYQIPASMNIPEDRGAAAYQWLEDAANSGFADAEYLLAIIYLNGILVDANYEKGVRMMRRAAIHGLDVAQYNLAMMYELGIHLPKNQENPPDWYTIDHGESTFWLQQAVKSKNESAILISLVKSFDRQNLPAYTNYTGEIPDFYYHSWGHLLDRGNFLETCTYDYDESHLNHYNYSYWKRSSCSSPYLEDDVIPSQEDPENKEEEYVPEDGCGDEYFEDEYDNEDDRLLNRRSDASLHYSIDYALDNLWLTHSAENPSHKTSRHLKALTLAGKGCRGTTPHGNPLEIAQQLIESDIDDNYNSYTVTKEHKAYKNLLLANFFYHTVNDKRKALELYMQSANQDNLIAKSILFNILHDKYEYNSKSYGLKHQEIQFYYWINEYFKSQDDCYIYDRTRLTEQIINKLSSQNKQDPNNLEIILKWYYRAINDAYHYFNEIKYIGDFNLVTDTFMLLQSAQNKLPHIQIDSQLVDEWARLAIEESNSNAAKKRLSRLPIIHGLDDAVIHQIQLEKNKKLSEFYVIKQVRNPYIHGILKRYELDAIYAESIQKAQNAIVALLLAQNVSPNPDIVKNTFFHLAIEMPRDNDFIIKCVDLSPVCDALLTHDMGNSSDNNEAFINQSVYRREVFFVWYLRQFPYAAEEVFKTMNLSGEWKNYIKKADELLNSSPKLREAMDYDPRLYLQKLPKMDFSQVPDYID